jgi:Asp-tRNA(Asn)/Glu-tRNA(Gln) amidotransferase A subunit family amidase
MIYDKSLAYYFKEEYAKHELMSPIFYDIIKEGLNISKEEYQEALDKQSHEIREFDQWMDPYDLLITLATADEAPIGLTTPDIPDANLIWTYLGLPIATLPALKGINGLPIGVSVIARKYNDKLLLEFLGYLHTLALVKDIQPISPITKGL